MFRRLSLTLLLIVLGLGLPLKASHALPLDPIDFSIIRAIMVDSDADGHADLLDNCPFWHNPAQTDDNWNKVGDVCEADYDQDLILDDGDGSGIKGDNPCKNGNTENCDDNCRKIPNPMQSNVDNDAKGDACDIDIDGDGLSNEAEAVLGTDPYLFDTDNDGVMDSWDCRPLDDTISFGELCFKEYQDPVPTDIIVPQIEKKNGDEEKDEALKKLDSDKDGWSDYEEKTRCTDATKMDTDGDGAIDSIDTCSIVANPDQADADGNEVGDLCENDYDGDGAPNGQYNCKCAFNPEQFDENHDGVGNFCDPTHPDFRVLDLKTIQGGGGNGNMGCQLQARGPAPSNFAAIFSLLLIAVGILLGQRIRQRL